MSKAPPAQAPPTDKGKGIALPVTPDKLRHKARLRWKQDNFCWCAGREKETDTSSTSSVGVPEPGDELQLKQLPSKVAKMESDWADLPAELLVLISEKASNTNVQYVHLRAVCKAWRRALTPNPLHLPRQTPWLLLLSRVVFRRSCINNCHAYLSFYDLSLSRTHRFELPDVDFKEIYGSYYGWLVLVCDNRVSLHNPITRRSIELPSFEAPPTIHVQKVMLSCNPSERGCVVVAWLLHLPEWELVFCRIGDTHWTGIMMRDAREPLLRNFTCNNKSVYMVNTNREVVAYDLDSLAMRTFPSKIKYHFVLDHIHLVEGDVESDGPLVVVTSRYLGNLEQVYVYKWINYEQRWRQVTNIGNSVLFLSFNDIFLGRSECTKLQFEELHGNEIYYDIRHDVATSRDVIRHDVAHMGFRIGINKMNLQSGGILPHCRSSGEVFYNKFGYTLWFTPSLI